MKMSKIALGFEFSLMIRQSYQGSLSYPILKRLVLLPLLVVLNLLRIELKTDPPSCLDSTLLETNGDTFSKGTPLPPMVLALEI